MHRQTDQQHSNECEYWRHHQDRNEQIVVDITRDDAQHEIEWHYANRAYCDSSYQPLAVH